VKRFLLVLTSVLLCFILVASSLVLAGSLVLRSTIFSADFFRQAISAPEYLPLVRKAIDADLMAQSSYVGIPVETLSAGIDDATLYVMISKHVDNVAAYMNGQADYTLATYPADRIYAILETYMKNTAKKEGYTPSAEQYTLLHAVADDTAKIVQDHSAVFDLGLVNQLSIFKKIHLLLYRLANLGSAALVTILAACLALILINRRDWRQWLRYILTSFWLTASVILVPTVVLQAFGLTRRLALETGYLKFAVDELMTAANTNLIFWSSACLVVCTAGLIFLMVHMPKIERNPPPKRKM
jgi:hypothetical protein